MATAKPQTIDAYIAGFPEDVQPVLQQLRQSIKEIAPSAEEKISYGMPTFTLAGRYFVYFAGWKKHVGVYGLSGAVEAFRDRLTPYLNDKGALLFPLSAPLPLALISDVVRLQVHENLDRQAQNTATEQPKSSNATKRTGA